MTSRFLFQVFACSCLFTIIGCEEVPPVVTPIGQQTSSDTTLQKILVEEFTGTRCVNCPAGSSELARLQEIYGDQLIIVAIHAGSFARPYPESQQDFRSGPGDALLNFLGQPLGYPSAVINRKLFPDEVDLQLSRSLWPIFLQQESQLLARIELTGQINFNPSSRRIDLELNLKKLTIEPTNDLRLSVMVVEDKVADYQLTPQGVDPDYVHRHNLRDMITAPTGNNLPSDWAEGESLMRTFQYILPESWQAGEVSLVAIVHEIGIHKDVWEVAQFQLPL